MYRTIAVAALLALLFRSPALAQQHTVIALSHSDYTVYELDPVSGRIVSQYKAEHQPHEGAVSPDGRTVYASIPSAGHVIVLDATQGLRLVKKIDSEYFKRSTPRGEGGNLNALPHGVALNTDGSKLYITVQFAEVPGIVVYDTKAGRVTKKIDILLEGGRQLAVDPRTEKIYYPMYDDDRVVVIDAKTDRILNIIPVEGQPVSADYTPNGEVWVHSDADGSVTVIDSNTDKVIKRIATGSEGQGRAAVSADGRYVASTRSGTGDAVIIDARTKEVAGRVPIGSMSYPIFAPDGSKLYVMSSRPEGGVTVVDMRTMRAEARHKVGTSPFGGAIRISGGR